MADKLSPEERSLLMARVRQTGTQPELIVRSVLRRMRLRYISHVGSLPGKPDLVLRDFRVAIFVHGCFWHNHTGCRRGSLPRSNRHFWLPKIASNVRRDRVAVRALRSAKWRVAIIWQCQTSDERRLVARIRRLAEGSRK